MKKGFRKGQAAMEFLMTYGWAILVVLVVIGALVYFMGPNIVQSMIPTKCVSGDAGLTCNAAKIGATTVNLRYTNNYDEAITITSIVFTKDGTAATGCTAPAYTAINPGANVNYAFTTCTFAPLNTLGTKVKLVTTTTFWKASETVDFAKPVKGEIINTVQ